MYSWNLYYKWLCSAEEGKADRGYSPLYLQPDRIYLFTNENMDFVLDA